MTLLYEMYEPEQDRHTDRQMWLSALPCHLADDEYVVVFEKVIFGLLVLYIFRKVTTCKNCTLFYFIFCHF